MKDSRVTVWTNTQSHLTGSTSNTGPTIDLDAGGSISGTFDRVGPFGLGIEIIQTYVSGTQTTVWEWEVSSDNATWRKGGFIGTCALTSTSDPANKRFKTALPEQGPGIRYARLLATNTGTGASTSVAYAEDFGGIPVSNVSYA